MHKLPIDLRKAVAVKIRQIQDQIILPLFHQQGEIESRDKGGSKRDLVTQADLGGEKELIKFLSELTPGCTIIGEESIGDDGAELERLRQKDGIVWTIDPIDGTNNFADKKPEFGTMVSCIIDGVTQHAWIFCPKLGGGTMLTATKDEGAFIERGEGGKQRLVAGMAPLQELTFGHYAVGREKLDHLPEADASIEEALAGYGAGFRDHNCTAADILKIVSGEKIALFYIGMKIWDAAPGWLILKEMGGSAGPIHDPDADIARYSGDGLMIFSANAENISEVRRAAAANPRQTARLRATL